MGETGATFTDRNFQKALKEYLNLRKNVDPPKELKRRAKNIGLRLIKIYKDKGVDVETISAKVNSLGNRVRVRQKIRRKLRKGNRLTHKQMIAAELRARRSAKGFTATGWFPSVRKLGGRPSRQERTGTGPQRGKLIEKLSGSDISETLVNSQPGAVVVLDKSKNGCQKALVDETADLTKYIVRKQNEVARKQGLT